jgi:hypothetical protein
MSTLYNSGYVPPIPVLQVAFGYGPVSRWLGPFEAIVDTGADATIVPETIAQQLRAAPLNTANKLRTRQERQT